MQITIDTHGCIGHTTNIWKAYVDGNNMIDTTFCMRLPESVVFVVPDDSIYLNIVYEYEQATLSDNLLG